MKINPPGHHLTEEQISDLLDGELADDDGVAAHLMACATCTTRLADLQALRAGLRVMRAVEGIPDFRLGVNGKPRTPTVRLPHPSARPPQWF